MGTINLQGNLGYSTVIDGGNPSASNKTFTLPSASGALVTTVNNTAPNAAGNVTLVTGKVLQVVTAAITTFVAVSATSDTDIGLSATITPSSTSSRILILATASITTNNGDSSTSAGWSIRDGANTTIIGSMGDVNPFDFGGYISATLNNLNTVQTKHRLHSPATTSAITYKMSGRNGTGTNITFNYDGNFGATSTITLMEIAA